MSVDVPELEPNLLPTARASPICGKLKGSIDGAMGGVSVAQEKKLNSSPALLSGLSGLSDENRTQQYRQSVGRPNFASFLFSFEKNDQTDQTAQIKISLQKTLDVLPPVFARTATVLDGDVFDQHEVVGTVAEIEQLSHRCLLEHAALCDVTDRIHGDSPRKEEPM